MINESPDGAEILTTLQKTKKKREEAEDSIAFNRPRDEDAPTMYTSTHQ